MVRVEEGNMISSVSFSDIGRGNYLSVGTLKGEVQIWDLAQQKKVRSLEGHTLRVGATALSGSVVASGSKDRSIYIRDLRS